METSRLCPSCHAPLPAGVAAEGLCPSCLLRAAILPEMTKPPEPVPAGRVFGDYEVGDAIGHGGMGIVYAARQISLNRKVALKMVRAPHLASVAELARFRQEAEAAARLEHPNIVPVYEAGEREGLQYFTMKLIKGARSLASELVKGPFDPKRAAEIVIKIARAVHYAHQRGVIHRDIKPANVLIDAEGEPLLGDFGLAKLQEAGVSLTQPDRVIGTPQYMSPEQVRGNSRELTTATDIYSLGAVLYEMLTGSPPFQSESLHELLRLVAEKDPKAPRQLNSKIDRDLQTICQKCLEKNAARRFASAEDLAADLESWIAVRPIKARPITVQDRVLKWARRNPLVASLSIGIVIAGIAAIGFLLRARDSDMQRQEQMRAMLVQAVNGLTSGATTHRLHDGAGRRWHALDSVKQAVNVLSNPFLPKEAAAGILPQLRNEAIACLSLVDMRPMTPWKCEEERAMPMVLSPDFKLIASGRADGDVVISNMPQHSVKAVLPGNGRGVNGVLRFGAGGSVLAVTYKGDTPGHRRLLIWDVSTEKVLHENTGFTGTVFDFDADGSHFLRADEKQLKLVSVDDGSVSRTITLDAAPRIALLSPDGRSIAVVTKDEGVRLVSIGNGSLIAGCDECGSVSCLAFDPKGRWLAIGAGQQIFMWDTRNPALSPRRWQGHDSEVKRIAWHPDGRHLASEADLNLSLWDARTGDLRASLEGQVHGALQFSSDGARLGLLRNGDQMNLLEVNNGDIGRHATGHPGRISGAAWNVPNGEVLATAADDGVRFWNRDGENIGHIPLPSARSVIWTPDAFIVTGGQGIFRWQLLRFDIGNRRLVLGNRKTIDDRPGWERAAVARWPAEAKDMKNSRENWLAVTHPERVLVLDLNGRKPPREFPGQPAAAFAAIGGNEKEQWLATGTFNGSGVRVRSLDSSIVLADLDVPGSANVSFSYDGQWLVTGSGDEYSFWKTGAWTKEASIRTSLGNYCGAMDFSSRLTAVAIESARNKIRILYPDPPNFIELAAPDFDSQSPLAFSPEGAVLVDVNKSHRIVMWNLARLRQELEALDLDWKLRPLPEPRITRIEEVVVEP